MVTASGYCGGGDIRQGRLQELIEDEFPYPNEEIYFPKRIWTIPVARDLNTGKSKLVLTQPDEVKEIRIGLHRWKARVGDIVYLGDYHAQKQLHETMRIPFVTETHANFNSDDMMGTDSIYIAGQSTVTHPELVHNLNRGEQQPPGVSFFEAEDNDANGNYVGWAFDEARQLVAQNGKFPGVHDELRVATVELVVSGSVQGTLELHTLLFTPM